ncbi:integrase arm-type DNA-binding domain-containing protein [Rhodoblastus sp. 17X3]|uniref:tyrosine-type recombinase/integrase n=1 Tax=Rhodoblastus sp. 17X3 TaxID=3047026 RepID=UPI0024B685E6|nr:integrase arm-type DNA-binding domain-containing protein [Rhodoblastus sp. 17X3]MDI9849020.1 integrase arm-type DNA-binding domain-containing protein [Rhodoblastus sp. 17X3]
MPLADVEIKKAKSAFQPYKMRDEGWLFLLVKPSGSKLWQMGYRFAGKEKTLSIGIYPSVLLKDARAKRDEAMALLAKGIDPSQQRKIEKQERVSAAGITFKIVAAEYQDKLRREGRAPAMLNKLKWLLSLVPPKFGERPIGQISTVEILAALKSVEARENLGTAKRLRATVGAVIRYAIAPGRAETDPTLALKGALVAPKAKHRAVEALDGQPETVAALKLLPLVFTRPGELRMAEWSEFDLDRRVSTIPASRTKMRREHLVPLASQALTVLADLKDITGGGRLVFPGIRSKERPICENTLNASLRRMGFRQDEVSARPHQPC